MFYKDHSWSEFTKSYLRTFGQEVPIYQPAVFREFRGEIFTTFHDKYHPAISKIGKTDNTHVRFSNSRAGVLRGLHYDFSTWKLVQALVGEIYLVVLDMRKKSTTYGKWEHYLLSNKTRDQVLIPPGFANGHLALEECIFHYILFYKGKYTDEKKQGVVAYNDPRYSIQWPDTNFIVQERDKTTSEINNS